MIELTQVVKEYKFLFSHQTQIYNANASKGTTLQNIVQVLFSHQMQIYNANALKGTT